MLAQLQKRLERLERERQKLLDSATRLSPARLSFRPTEDCWSVLQVLDHLVKVEAGVLRTVKSQLSHPATLTLRDRIGGLAVNAVMLSPQRVKVPAAGSRVLPGVDLELDALLEAWTEVRTKLAELLEPLQPEQLRGGVFRHPIGGWMSVPTTLDFVWAHIRHHTYQIRRLASESQNLAVAG